MLLHYQTDANKTGYEATRRSKHQDWKSPALVWADERVQRAWFLHDDYIEIDDGTFDPETALEFAHTAELVSDYRSRVYETCGTGNHDHQWRLSHPETAELVVLYKRQLEFYSSYHAIVQREMRLIEAYWSQHADDCECTPEPRERTCTYCHQRAQLRAWAEKEGIL